MTSLEAILRRIKADLTQAGVSFALIGGLAVSVRTEPRFTRDADPRSRRLPPGAITGGAIWQRT